MLKNDAAVRSVWLAAGKPAAPSAEDFNPAIANRGAALFTKPVSINFPIGDSQLSAEAMAVVNQQILPQLEIAGGMSVRVEGNTDGIGERIANQALSEKRAAAIVEYLVARGVPRTRLVARGNGWSKPVAMNSTAEGRAKNRRTDVLFIRGARQSRAMADVQIAPTSYLGYAFKDQHNLVVLFGAVCFSAAFASPVPLLVGAVSELLWLSIGPNLPIFRDWVDRRLNAQYLARAEVAIEGALGELSERDANRYRALAGNAAQIIASAEGRLPADQVRLALHGLLELRRTFLDYLFLGQRVEALARRDAERRARR